ncbi:MAG: cyclic nucleotide-binding domain-containing protein [Gammaproteobacteria bacterium]|nr:cyclic nucleotide-binding domain-containing protein [Gammaproteobacteria bacterium]
MSEGNDKYVQLIRNLIPISELPAQSQTELINSGSLLNIKKKGALFNQGDRDNFSYYLLEGEIELVANNQQQNVIVSGSDRALYAMAQLQPRQFSAKAKIDSVVFQIQRDTLDRLMVMQQEDEPAVDMNMESTDVEVGGLEEDEDVDWMTRMLQSELFARLPTANIGQLFALLTEVHFSKGEVVIKQGDPGDKYYIVQDGKCDVLRTPPSGGEDLKLATLGVGDSFGEEALVSDSIRNATIVMASDGVLMELSKENFIELIKKPSLSSVSYEEATGLIKEGAIWLDVRFKKEHESHAIADSVHIPLNMLRMQVNKLDVDKKYIVYCDTGGRSSTGAFLLAERAFDVCYLEGGIVNNPDAADKSEVTHVPKEAPKAAAAAPAEPAAEPPPAPKPAPAPEPAPEPAPAPKPAPAPEAAPTPEPVPAAEPAPAPEPVAESKTAAEPESPVPSAPVKEDVVDQISRQNLDPDVKASVLEAELNRTNMELEAVEKVKKQADVSIKEAQAQVEKQLQEERAKIEQAKKEAESEAIKLRQQEEEKIAGMKLEAEKRMEEEKQKLEEVYSRNAAEMEKIEQMKAEAEALVQQERERLAQAAEQARLQMEEAEALKAQMEAALQKEAEESRQQLEEAAALKKQMEESREKAAAETNKQLQEAEAIKNEIDALRQKEAEEAAQKLAEAQKMKEEVEASRKAMEDADQKRRMQQEEME